MNYLAHAYLSFTDGQIVGNFIEDFVENSQRLDYPEEIRKGIKLHRAIDTFTDAHPIISEAKKIFQPRVRLYSGAFVDIAMDYFLANDLSIFTEKEWKDYAEKTYLVLGNHAEWLPEKLTKILPNMQQNNWLFNYRNDWAIEKSFLHLKRKAKYLDEEIPVFDLFLNHKAELKAYYNAFFPELYEHCKTFHLKEC